MGLEEWVVEQLSKGMFVVSSQWFLEPSRSGVSVSLQLDLPSPDHVFDFVYAMKSPYDVTSGKVMCMGQGVTVPIANLAALLESGGVRRDQPMVVHAEGPGVYELMFKLNYVESQDKRQEVSFESLRLLTFPHSSDSRALQLIDVYSAAPYRFQLPALDDPLPFETQKFGDRIVAAARSSRYTRNFEEAANTTACVDAEQVFGLVDELRRVEYIFSRTRRGSDSAVDLDIPVRS